MPDIALFAPHQVINPGEAGPPPLEQYPLQFLAQGDSWFSFGAFPPMLTTNLFDKMSLATAACAINCASPGMKLHRMTNTTRERNFLNLLNGNVARRWSGLLISGGGNDLIEAAQVGPSKPAHLRLLATQTEWRPLPDGDRYLSEAGWQTFADHLKAVFVELLKQRDKKPVNSGIPVIVHTYDVATPRNSSAGLGAGPWLFPTMKAFGIPEPDWIAVSAALSQRLSGLLAEIAAADPVASIHVVDTLGTLQPASTDDRGPTQDWQNEIHPTGRGYRTLADKWEVVLAAVFTPVAPPP